MVGTFSNSLERLPSKHPSPSFQYTVKGNIVISKNMGVHEAISFILTKFDAYGPTLLMMRDL